MTTTPLSSTPGPVGFPLVGALAIAVPPSGDPAVPADFALALAEIVATPDLGISRPKLADPGNSVPVADTTALLSAAASPGDPLLAPETDSGEPKHHAGGEVEKVDSDDDPVLDPALSWLIAPAPMVAKTASVAVPVPVAVEVAVAVQCASTTLLGGRETTATIAKHPAATSARTELAATSGSPAEPVAVETSAALQVPVDAEPASPEAPALPDPVVADRRHAKHTPVDVTTIAQPTVATQKLANAGQTTPDPALTKAIAGALVRLPAAVDRPLPIVPPRFSVSRISPTLVTQPMAMSTPAGATTTPIVGEPGQPAAATVTASLKAPAPAPALILAVAKSLEGPAVPAREAAMPPQMPNAGGTAPAASRTDPAMAAIAAPTIATIGLAAGRPLPRPTELRPVSDSGATLFGSAFASALTSTVTTPAAVQPTIDTQSPGMDLTRDTGLHRMIDRIEMLRDDADARDTRIRLVPDALGPVEVSVRRDGDAVRIHFTAEQAATRALIADAQPRLGELAEARGVKISQASVDTGTAGDGRARQQPPPTTQSSATPRRVDSEPDNSSDDRIA